MKMVCFVVRDGSSAIAQRENHTVYEVYNKLYVIFTQLNDNVVVKLVIKR